MRNHKNKTSFENDTIKSWLASFIKINCPRCVTTKKFQKVILDYYRDHGRKLPWRKTKDPYKIFVSEVMLQQTRVSRVLTKYPEFIKTFPSFRALANANLRDVLRVWQGMGYNRRAFYLKQSAKIIVDNYAGKLPNDPKLLEQLPGIGKATAASIAVFAFNAPIVFIETNIRRVFIYHFFASRRLESVRDIEIFPLIARTLDYQNSRKWYWALMDYGSMLGTALPKLKIGNPNHKSAHYTKSPRFEGSARQLRGQILKLLIAKPLALSKVFAQTTQTTKMDVRKCLATLMRDKLIKKQNGKYTIS